MTNSIENKAIQKNCPNCGHDMPAEYRYCSFCGQKNSQSRIKLKDLLSDFFEGLFNLDNKIFKTLAAIWVPGKLTRLFFEGKRKCYTHPLRLYLFLSFVVFGFIGLSFNQSSRRARLDATLDTKAKLQHKKDLRLMDSLVAEIQTHSPSVNYGNGAEALMYLYALNPKDIVSKDSLEMELAQITIDTNLRINPMTRSELMILQNYEVSNDSFQLTKQRARQAFNKEIEADSLNVNFPWFQKYTGIYGSLAFTDLIEMPLDSLYVKYEAKKYLGKLYIAQSQKIVRNPANALFYILGGFSWIAILFIPFMALFHSLIYIRRKYYYVEHLVFVVHCTSLAFLLFIILIGLVYLGVSELVTLFFLIFPLYILFAMKRFYKQNWTKTIFKWLLGQNIALLLILGIAVLSFFLRMLLY
jgi:hypothetical protein